MKPLYTVDVASYSKALQADAIAQVIHIVDYLVPGARKAEGADLYGLARTLRDGGRVVLYHKRYKVVVEVTHTHHAAVWVYDMDDDEPEVADET